MAAIGQKRHSLVASGCHYGRMMAGVSLVDHRMVTRRGLLLMGGIGLIAAHPLGRGQPASVIHRVGVLLTTSEATNAHLRAAFTQALRDLGWVEGTNIEYRIVSANGDVDRLDALANELITYITENPDTIPDDATLYIIRNMNPDGEARSTGAEGRVNNNGVDLNRNFPSKNWTADWDRYGCWIDLPTTGGSYPGSEPETRTVTNFIRSHKIQAVISYHSAALGVFPGGIPWEKSSKRLAKALAKVTGYSYPPVDTGCEYTGTLADWAVENGVGAAVDMELSDHKNTDFQKNLDALRVFLNFEP